MNLIYYYPMKEGAPSKVARNIFDVLYVKRNELPFEEIAICTDLKSKRILAEKFKDINILSIKEIFKIDKKDVIHIPVSPFVFPNIKLLLHFFAKLNKNKIILNYHGDLRNEIKLKYKSEKKIDFTDLPTYLLIPSLLTNTSEVIVNSHLLKNIIVNNYGVKSTSVIPNAVEDYWFLEDEEYIIKYRNDCEIFYHGRLSPEKGVDMLIKGFHKFLHEKNYPDNVSLYIAGEGSQRKYLQCLVQELKITDKVFFLGNLDRKLIKSYLKRVDGAIYPSIWDGFSLSILEALASANCPVFFSRKAGVYDFVTEENALNTFNPNINTVANIFHYIFEKKTNKEVIERQKKFAKKYTWDKIIDQYIQIYREVCNNRVNKYN